MTAATCESARRLCWSRVSPACTWASSAPPGRWESMTTVVGARAPAPTASERMSRPWTLSRVRGMPLFEPGPSSRASTGSASATSSAVLPAAMAAGWRMIVHARRAQTFSSASRRSVMERGRSRTRSSFAARKYSRTGSRVSAQATEIIGMNRPPMPKPRMNGRGMASISVRPMATAVPLNTTARPAVAIVATIASCVALPLWSSSR